MERLGERGVPIRRCFESAAGRCFVSVDYRQIEMRIFAHCSQDPRLAALFDREKGSDIYSVIAGYILGKKQGDEVSEKERDQAKVITLVGEWMNTNGNVNANANANANTTNANTTKKGRAWIMDRGCVMEWEWRAWHAN